MSNFQSPIKKYPLLPYSQLVFDMQRTNPDVYVSRMGVRIRKDEVDIPRLRQAIADAIRNHPVFSMRVDKEGKQHFEPLSDVFHGQYHAVDFVEHDEFIDVLLQGNRILGDGWSDVMIIMDVMRAYKGEPLPPDMYIRYLEHVEEMKQSARYESNRQWLLREFGDIRYPVHPQTDKPLETLESPIEGNWTENYSSLRSALKKLSEAQLITLTGVFSLASGLAMMEYNDADEVALTWAYDGRETEEEQYIYGSLHRDIPFHIRKSVIDNRESAIRETRKQFRNGIAHSSYPLTLTKPYSEIWNYALNVLVQHTMQEKTIGIPFAFEPIEMDSTQHIAYSLLDVEIYEGEELIINYRYSATHYKESSIRRFAALVRKYAEWLLQ
ncbi:MAG: hypothetical protein IJS57_06910 [Paludibacteraceae bacterium]|nr:hypothetical protein [Paludibacteraceae bacterium]